MRQLPKRLLYLAYYVSKMDWALLGKFAAYVKSETGRPFVLQLSSAIYDSVRFNVSVMEYYQFRFFDLSDREKSQWAGTGTMYEFQRHANPPPSRAILEDKRLFYKTYKEYFRHKLFEISDLESNRRMALELLEANDKLVFKEARGSCGIGVEFKSVIGMTPDQLTEYMRANGYDLVETHVQQHPFLSALSPAAVNTIRIFTQLTSEGTYEVLGARLRISVDSPVDNLAAGNIAAPIDITTGEVNGPGVYSDMTRKPETVHPVTGQAIVGFRVPYWSDTLAMIREASFLCPENRSVGWDVVVTREGPGLIEGNHDWCKLVWQLPVGRGLKELLDISR